MNRSPHRIRKNNPAPLRGRLAATVSIEQQQKYSRSRVRYRRPIPKMVKTLSSSELSPSSNSNLVSPQELPTANLANAETPTSDLRSPQTYERLSFWQWLIGLFLIIVLLILIGNLFNLQQIIGES